MPKITPTGTETGAAVQDYTTQSAGTWSGASPTAPKLRVTVTGKSAAEGNEFLLDATLYNVDEVLGTDKPTEQYTGSFNDVFAMANYTKSGLSALDVALSTLSKGDLFQSGGKLYLVVDVPLHAPAEGYAWVLDLTGTAVAQMDSTTTVEHRPGQATDIKLA